MTLQLTTFTVIRGAAPVKKAIHGPWLFKGVLPEPPLFPCSSIDWTTVFCIGLNRRGLQQLAELDKMYIYINIYMNVDI